jgi:hypothetical protein
MDPTSKPALGDPLESFPSLRLFRQYEAQWTTFATHADAYELSEPIARCLRLGDRNAGHGIPRPAQRNRVTR